MKGRLASISLMTFVLIGMSISVHAEKNNIQVGRYLSVSTRPYLSQMDLLSQIISVHFPQNTKTVNDAISYLLRFSGYSLIAPNKNNGALNTVLSKPLPLIDHELGPISIRNGLQVLIGPAFNLSEDPVSRTVNFHLRKEFVNIKNSSR